MYLAGPSVPSAGCVPPSSQNPLFAVNGFMSTALLSAGVRCAYLYTQPLGENEILLHLYS